MRNHVRSYLSFDPTSRHCQCCRQWFLFGYYVDLSPVLDLPVVLQLTSDRLELLLLTALAIGNDDDVLLLCRHAAAANLSPAAAGGLLAAAVQLSSSKEDIDSILALPQMDSVTLCDILPAVRAAISCAPVTKPKHLWSCGERGAAWLAF